MIKLYHYTDKKNLKKILREGLKATSRYEAFTELRRNVIYCWLSPDDQKLFSDDTVCFEISVDEESCTVAEMDYISLAMMYKYGGEKYGGKNIPINLEASRLFTKIYEVTSVPVLAYSDNFFSPEVLVHGDISPERISLYKQKSNA